MAEERGTPALGNREIGHEALRFEHGGRPPDVALADDDVEVAELAQREMADTAWARSRSLERHGLDAAGIERRQQPQQLAGEEQPEGAVLLRAVAQRSQRRRRHAGRGETRQVAMQQRPEAVAGCERQHTIPVEPGIDERTHLRAVFGRDVGPAAEEQQGGLAIVQRSQIDHRQNAVRPIQS